MESKHCEYVREDGTRCMSYKQTGKRFCWIHDPDKAVERSVAVRKGGQECIVSKDVEVSDGRKIRVAKAKDIRITLVRIMNLLRERKISPTESNALTYTCSCLIRALELQELSKRLDSIAFALSQRDRLSNN